MTDTNQTGAAFRELLEFLMEADKTFLNPDKGMDRTGIADGYRHLAHLLSYGFDCYLESDPLRPVFIPMAQPSKKILGDNTDSVYRFTQINGDRPYRIAGRRGNDCYFSITVYGGKPDGEWSDRVALTLNHRDIAFGDDGSFTLVLTPDPKGEGEYTLDEDSVCVITREYFWDPDQAEPAELHITSMKEEPAPGPPTDEDLARRFRAVTTFLKETLLLLPMPVTYNTNSLGEPFGFGENQRGWGTPDNVYSLGTFDLADDEALEITFTSPGCAYWGIQTWNFYMQSLDYRYHQVSINASRAVPEEDGSYRVLVSKSETGAKNRVSTAGYNKGMVFCRWLLADVIPEQPKCRVVKLSEV